MKARAHAKKKQDTRRYKSEKTLFSHRLKEREENEERKRTNERTSEQTNEPLTLHFDELSHRPHFIIDVHLSFSPLSTFTRKTQYGRAGSLSFVKLFLLSLSFLAHTTKWTCAARALRMARAALLSCLSLPFSLLTQRTTR